MNPTCQPQPLSYGGYRFPPEVINYAVWLYYRLPRVMITAKLKSYAVAKADLALNLEHRQHKGLND